MLKMFESRDISSFRYYYCDPSLAAAVVFVSLFAITTILHLVQLIRKRTWYFIPFVIGGIFETIGYIGRTVSATQTPNWTLNPYIIQTLLLLIAPALFAASVYMILGRIVRLVDGAPHSIIPVQWLTKIFVATDVISFFMQGAGGGMLSSAKNQSGLELGENIIIGGLVVQLVGFSVFIVVASIFHWRTVRQPTEASRTIAVDWQRFMYVLYAVSALILVRSVFRTVEYAQGFGGSLQQSEVWLYVFDATLMFLASALLVVWHPSQIVAGRGRARGNMSSEYVSEEGFSMQQTTPYRAVP
ncbi:hypothetical protein LQW54_006388 [Pestalotiopsis sp. IQ-011]